MEPQCAAPHVWAGERNPRRGEGGQDSKWGRGAGSEVARPVGDWLFPGGPPPTSGAGSVFPPVAAGRQRSDVSTPRGFAGPQRGRLYDCPACLQPDLLLGGLLSANSAGVSVLETVKVIISVAISE